MKGNRKGLVLLFLCPDVPTPNCSTVQVLPSSFYRCSVITYAYVDVCVSSFSLIGYEASSRCHSWRHEHSDDQVERDRNRHWQRIGYTFKVSHPSFFRYPSFIHAHVTHPSIHAGVCLPFPTSMCILHHPFDASIRIVSSHTAYTYGSYQPHLQSNDHSLTLWNNIE